MEGNRLGAKAVPFRGERDPSRRSLEFGHRVNTDVHEGRSPEPYQSRMLRVGPEIPRFLGTTAIETERGGPRQLEKHKV